MSKVKLTVQKRDLIEDSTGSGDTHPRKRSMMKHEDVLELYEWIKEKGEDYCSSMPSTGIARDYKNETGNTCSMGGVKSILRKLGWYVERRRMSQGARDEFCLLLMDLACEMACYYPDNTRLRDLAHRSEVMCGRMTDKRETA